jgi:predicted dehydrogenase
MPSPITRRSFIKTSSALAAGLYFQAKDSPNEKLGIAVVGVGNRGAENLTEIAHERIVALCDVDENYLNEASARFPQAARYRDFRRMLERNDIDAVLVATADHSHAPVTLAALQSGRHVYCEKPLAHTVAEVRKVRDTAIRLRRATQMGTQIHALPTYRRVVELIRANAIGPIREVHVFCDKCWGGATRPTDTPPVPSTLDYDLWLGPATNRPYSPAYHPASWRRFWDFGGGTIGDMACHYLDLPFWALDLDAPTSVEAEGPPPDADATPRWLTVRWEFPARGARPPVKLHWYDGKEGVDRFVIGQELGDWRNGVMFFGDHGMLVADYYRHQLLPIAKFETYTPPIPSIPDSIGHHAEWIQACRSGGGTTCQFDYSGPLTETVLLGIVAYRSGEKLSWDARSMRTSSASANRWLEREYRHGWEI